MGVIRELNEIIHVKHLVQHPAQSKDSLNVILIINSFATSKKWISFLGLVLTSSNRVVFSPQPNNNTR